MVDVELVERRRTVRRIRVHAGGADIGAGGLWWIAPVPKAQRVAHLVAGDMVAARVIGEEDGIARVEVEMQLLVAAPASAARVESLRRIARTVDPPCRPVVAVVARERDHV